MNDHPVSDGRLVGYAYFESFSPKLVCNTDQHVEATRDPETGIFYDWRVVDDLLHSDDGLETDR